MSGKLDQSLDEILSTQRRSVGGRRGGARGGRRSVGRAVATVAPVGGVTKTSKQKGAAAAKQTPAKGALAGDSKVVVSNLPKDVNEAQIKEYFISSVGHVKRVELSYGPNSMSRGIATVTFGSADGAQRAFKALNGLLVDNRPIKIEIVVSAANAAMLPAPKTLTDRITQPKSQPKAQPKSAASTKKDTATKDTGSGAAGARGRGRGARRVKSARPAKKTAEELDSEMADYWGSGNPNENANGSAPAAGNDDAAMEDEISVCCDTVRQIPPNANIY
ncbi:RNA recognition domain-containing protein [Apiospora phragmitis]|uniref:RNA recognition domain-containing protein n=1 Tax=Apiospora phragmitis TaxID=2905665 RepID=A0ABR1WVC0_9PEZI